MLIHGVVFSLSRAVFEQFQAFYGFSQPDPYVLCEAEALRSHCVVLIDLYCSHIGSTSSTWLPSVEC